MSSREKPYFPIFVDLSGRKVVVAGAGTIAKRRIRVLADFTDHLVVIAPEVNPELRAMEAEGKITILRKTYEREDIRDAALVIAATNSHQINQEIYAACRELGIPVNVCSDREKCDFYFPVIAFAGDVVAGVSSSGRARRKSRDAADRIQKLFEELQ